MELESLKNVLLAYQEEFTAEKSDAFGSPLYQVSMETEFSFYHYKSSGQNTIWNSSELLKADKRFSFSYYPDNTAFSNDAKLFRGCVRLSR